MTERITQGQYRALTKMQTGTGRSLRDVAEIAIANAQAAQDEVSAADAGQPKRKRKSNAPLSAKFVDVQPAEGELVFVLPLPPKKISPNARGHWRPKADAVKQYRRQCAAAMLTQVQSRFSDSARVVVDLEFYLCRLHDDATSYYPKDEDNARAAMKAAQDALKDVGIIPGDGKKHVAVGRTILRTNAKEHQGYTCVVMRLRPEAK